MLNFQVRNQQADRIQRYVRENYPDDATLNHLVNHLEKLGRKNKMAFEGLTDRLQKAMEKLRHQPRLQKLIFGKRCVRFGLPFRSRC